MQKFKTVIISFLTFGCQIGMLHFLSKVYPPYEYRTGLLQGFTYLNFYSPGLVLNYLSYISFIAFILGIIFINHIKNRSEILIEEYDIKQVKDLWTKIFKIRSTDLVLTLFIYILIVVTLKSFGAVETTEPLLITIAWTLDDILGIYITLTFLSISYYTMRIINEIIQGIKHYDITNPDGICGFKSLGSLSTLNSTYLSIINSIFFFPWILVFIKSGFDLPVKPPGLVLIRLFVIFDAIMIFLLPFILFLNNAININSTMQKIKIDNISELTKEYNEIHDSIRRSLREPDENINLITLTCTIYMSMNIDRISKLKEWPIDILNASMLLTSLSIQLFEIFFHRF